VVADAVSEPGAVMVHLEDAGVTDRAVVGALGLPVLAGHAVRVAVLGLHGWNRLWPLETALEVGPKIEELHEVEHDTVYVRVHPVLHPLVHLLCTVTRVHSYVVHEVDGEDIHSDYDCSHGPDEDVEALILSDGSLDEAVTEHAHL